MNTKHAVALTFAVISVAAISVAATSIRPELLTGLVWRNIGPFRGGRISAVSGVTGDPGTFYIGMPAGGVWKTTNAGATWWPIFDNVKDAEVIGALEVAPSDGNTVYVGTGDLIAGGGIGEGNGMYKSTDAGATWTHIGLGKTKQIPSIVVHPRDANIVLVAAQGDVRHKSDDRGVFRSTNGGTSWTRTLFVDDSTGIQKLAIAFDRPDVVFATTVRHYSAPAPGGLPVVPPGGLFGGGGPAGGQRPQGPTGTSIYKSLDGAVTWKELTGGALPRIPGRTSIAVANGTNAQRVYFTTNIGFFRSDDGGATWKQMDAIDTRIRNGQGGYNCGVYVDPKNPDVVYVFNTAAYISRDGGNTFTGFKGAPGGDDPQQGWIDPTNGKRMILGYDQGAIVSLDGGDTWSSWYNQSNEQVYHVSTDNSFPYWIYASQQDAGAVRTRARGNLGAVTPLDWDPVNGWEWGTILPDPLDANTVYATGNGVIRISFPSEQWVNVSPAQDQSLRLRVNRDAPLVFDPWDEHRLLVGFQYLMSTSDGGMHWTKISPNLGYPASFATPPDTATPKPGEPIPGTIMSIGPSTVAHGTIWVGINTGLVKLTRDNGRTWNDVSGFSLPGQIHSVEPSHTNAAEAYITADRLGSADYKPYVYRTRDYGKTWTLITNGLATDESNGSYARILREDPKRPGLLFLGTESAMYVSFDDGDSWQSLMLSLPTTSFRDIAFRGNDLIVGTYGRGIFVLDDYAVLRQITNVTANEDVHLFKPDGAVRMRRNVGADTPFPPEAPHALNPPDGAIIYYWLGSRPSGRVTLDVLDSAGAVVRHYSSDPITPVPEAARPPHPNFWVKVEQPLPTDAGMHRVNWDLRYDAPPAFTHSFEINANPGETPASPEGALVPPGAYAVRLTVNGKAQTQKVTVTSDPRSPASLAALKTQDALIRKLNALERVAWDAFQLTDTTRAQLRAMTASDSTSNAAKAIREYIAKLDTLGGRAPTLGGGFGGGDFFGGNANRPTLVQLINRILNQLGTFENGDVAPTAAMLAAYQSACNDLAKSIAAWRAISGADLTTLNAALTAAGKTPLVKAVVVQAAACGP
jgi:Sortilin, neurotensin receptor 3,